MSFNITYTAHFEKEAKRLAKKYPSLIEDILAMVSILEQDPQQGTPLGKSLFKIRIAIESKGKGKSGGARIITYVVFNRNTVYLTSIYDKSEQANVSIQILLKLLREEGLDG